MTVESAALPLLMLTMTLLVHLVTTIWWAASLTKRVEHIEKWIGSNERTAERLAALEQRLDDMSSGIFRIEQYLRSKG
jgi:hypothetical protein